LDGTDEHRGLTAQPAKTTLSVAPARVYPIAALSVLAVFLFNGRKAPQAKSQPLRAHPVRKQ
jgi:hypothetical protein